MDIKGAIVRSYNPQTGEYYLTKRYEMEGVQVYYASEEQLVKET